ncbi:uncharacterized protein ATNIH1004_001667 [Aspergillus tanneri]|uniref:C2H2-type domain-containing protein n=1 Tax=Aspergillus tanneri TaxID=1220188 RepID=A0A5M9N096_9EURO|nr:uncharacterized protein ATNIH1004_001667 [Aspergillus tanneri]KAA8652762.1 hypothetical protein ATNIH1004_001667 [Aspergillus tanneri]
MSGFQRQCDTLKRIIQNSSIRLICPQCLRGFPRSDALYRHFREQEDDIHKGLDMRDTDHKTFLSCYQTAIGASIPAVELPIGVKCFEVLFVVEHYREDVEKHQRIPPGTTSQSGSTYSPMNTLTELVLPHGPESLLGTEFSTSAHHSQGEIVDAESIMEWDNWLLSSVDDIEWNEN